MMPLTLPSLLGTLVPAPVLAQVATLVVAQLGPGGPTVTPLPAAPLFERFVLIHPWPVAALLALAGLVVAIVVRARWRVAAAGTLGALAGATLAAGMLVTTDRERLVSATRDLIDVTAGANTVALAGVLAPDARLFADVSIQEAGLSTAGAGIGRDAILRLVADNLGGRYPLKEHDVLEVQSTLVGPDSGRTQVRVRAVLDALGFPIASWWRIEWRREADGSWRAVSIRLLYLPIGGP